MTNTHKLSVQNHFDFLNQDRKDPITGDLIKENDEVVICASCKSAFLKDSWEYLGNTHCEQDNTLAAIPERSNLELKTGLILSLPNETNNPNKAVRFLIFIALITIGLGAFSLLYYNLDKPILCIFFIAFIGFLFSLLLSTNKILPSIFDLYSSYLIAYKNKVAYKDIEYIVVTYTDNPSMTNNIFIKQKCNTRTKIPLENGRLDKNEKLLYFLTVLALYTTVKFRIDQDYRNCKNIKAVTTLIEWI